MTSKDFQALQAEWYAKLALTGFVDIESTGASRNKTAEYRLMNMSKDTRAAKEDYYYRAFQALERQKFSSPELRKLWRLHANGAYNGDIAKQLGMTTYSVRQAIYKLQRRFGLCSR